MNNSINVGGSVVRDGLVALYDVANMRSYEGEPTENLVSNPNFTNGFTDWNLSRYNPNDNTHEYVAEIIDVNGPVGEKAVWFEKREHDVTPLGYIRLYSKWFPVNAGDTLTISAWVKLKDLDSGSLRISVHLNGPTVGTISVNQNIGEWQRIATSYLVPEDGQLRVFPNWTQGSGGIALVQGVQVEKKSYATPFTPTSRPASNGWKNLMSNNLHFDLDNISFNENGLYFNGVDNVIARSGWNNEVGNTWTFGSWIKFLSSSSENQIYMSFTLPYLMMIPSGRPRLSWRDEGGTQRTLTASSQYALETNKWYYIIGTHNGGNTAILYINGENVAESSNSVGSSSIGTNLRLGAHGSSFYSHCEQNSIQVYDRALSPEEVQHNYNSTKSRYGH